MPQRSIQNDVFESDHHFLSPAATSPRKSLGRQPISARRSTASLRDDDAANGRQHSLAHELAVALMPEPNSSSKLLAQELGIDFDEGPESGDEALSHQDQLNEGRNSEPNGDVPTFAYELAATSSDASFNDVPEEFLELDHQDPSPQHDFQHSKKPQPEKLPERDAIDILASDLEFTDNFLNHLRTIDTDATSSSSQQPKLEVLASDVIGRINMTVRDREGHVRELLEYEREFRKIAGEVGGTDILGQLEELTYIEDLSDNYSRIEPLRADSTRHLETVEEEPKSHSIHFASSSDWELDPDRILGDADDITEPATSPIKDSFPSVSPITGPPTLAITATELMHLRSFTASLVSSLTTVSEHAQVNGAATTEAGRKIRALKNKLGGWRTEWESAERSRSRIEKWEEGVLEGGSIDASLSSTSKRVDGRQIVQEHLRAFEVALSEAALKTQAIMAR